MTVLLTEADREWAHNAGKQAEASARESQEAFRRGFEAGVEGQPSQEEDERYAKGFEHGTSARSGWTNAKIKMNGSWNPFAREVPIEDLGREEYLRLNVQLVEILNGLPPNMRGAARGYFRACLRLSMLETMKARADLEFQEARETFQIAQTWGGRKRQSLWLGGRNKAWIEKENGRRAALALKVLADSANPVEPGYDNGKSE